MYLCWLFLTNSSPLSAFLSFDFAFSLMKEKKLVFKLFLYNVLDFEWRTLDYILALLYFCFYFTVLKTLITFSITYYTSEIVEQAIRLL